MVSSALNTLGPWAWIILGLALMGLELLAPGVFFLWLGLAALLTGLIDWGFGLSWQASALSFAVLSVVAVLAGRAITRRPDEEDEAASNLNRRAHALIGQTFTLEAPIVDGSGRIRVGDSSWRVTGPSAPAGASVRVVRVEGATLVVETV
jgi:membrane protein implicated in regulation of membrane protease activity